MSEQDFCAVNFDVGCMNRMTFVISQSAMLIATGATTVAFIQVRKLLYNNTDLKRVESITDSWSNLRLYVG